MLLLMEYFDFKERIIEDVAIEAHNNGNIFSMQQMKAFQA